MASMVDFMIDSFQVRDGREGSRPTRRGGPGGSAALGGFRDGEVAQVLAVDGIGLEGASVIDLGRVFGSIVLAEHLVLVFPGEQAVDVVHEVALVLGELVARGHEHVVDEGDEGEDLVEPVGGHLVALAEGGRGEVGHAVRDGAHQDELVEGLASWLLEALPGVVQLALVGRLEGLVRPLAQLRLALGGELRQRAFRELDDAGLHRHVGVGALLVGLVRRDLLGGVGWCTWASSSQ